MTAPLSIVKIMDCLKNALDARVHEETPTLDKFV